MCQFVSFKCENGRSKSNGHARENIELKAGKNKDEFVASLMINDVGAIKQSQPGGHAPLAHYIFISRAFTLIFPVIESKHLKPVEEGCSDCKDAELCQAILQKSRPVGHCANLSRKEVHLTSAKCSPPRAQAMLREALEGGGLILGSRGALET